MITTRAKFECVSVLVSAWSKTYEFQPVMGTAGNPENEQFFKTTPGGKLSITIKNENVNFIPGKSYYLDFTLAE